MTKYNPNVNHPEKGRSIKVDPIRSLKNIRSIKQLLESKPRDYLLFVMGINNGLRVGDLLKLRVSDVEGLKPGQSIPITEAKTGKENVLMINRTVFKAIKKYIQHIQPDDDDFLFASPQDETTPDDPGGQCTRQKMDPGD